MTDTPDILKKILERKAEEIAERSARVSLHQLQQRAQAADAPRGFVDALETIKLTIRRRNVRNYTTEDKAIE